MNEALPRRFRTVPKHTVRLDMTVEEFASAIMEEMKADAPVAVFVAWEVPDGTIRVRCVPESEALKRGLVHTLHERIFCERPEE